MTLAFKWSHRYEGEGSLEYDQCIELLKCSLILFRLCPPARALIGPRSLPAMGSGPPRGRAPASAAAAVPLPWPRAPPPAHARLPREPLGGRLGVPWAGEAVTASEADLGVWVEEGSGRACLSCPRGCRPAHARGQRQRKDTSVRSFVRGGKAPAAQGRFVGLGMFCGITGIR